MPERAFFMWILRESSVEARAHLRLWAHVGGRLAVLYLVPTIIQLSSAIGYLLPVYAALVFIRKKAAAKAAKAALPARAGEPGRPPLALPEPRPTAAE